MRVLWALWMIGALGCATAGDSATSGDASTGSSNAPCASGTRCGDQCVETSNNSAHCGQCNNGCSAGESCLSGTCQACAETSAEARSEVLPADIILVVDNSPSMADEARFVQSSMNSFVRAIRTSGIDARVILIARGSSGGAILDTGVCVPAPLGSGSCPNDEKLPKFRHVMENVNSSNALDKILSTYSSWSTSLRPNASRALMVISDDDSGMSAADFSQSLLNLDATFQGFRFSAVVAPYELDSSDCLRCNVPLFSSSCSTCDPCCGSGTASGSLFCAPLPADEGRVYKELVSTTQGVLGDLCTQDFEPVFQELATAVIRESQVPCLYVIPEPPEGDRINLGEVNVAFRATPQSMPETLPKVASEMACAASGGWFYSPSASPTHIKFCPTTCTQVQAANAGAVSIKLGCATVVLE